MARIKKFGGDIPQNLSSVSTFLVDGNPNSDYFRITEFKEQFTGGKNGFLIEGSQFLKETTEVKIEILDVEGNTIYYEPGEGVPEYYEGLSKVIAVYIYEDTPIGNAKITILGELKTYLDTGGVIRDVPEDWKELYNVKWEKEFKINKNLTNEDKVRFFRRPEVSITEIARPIFTANPINITQTGNVLGTPIIPSEGTNITQFPRPSQYLLTTLDNTRWTGSVINSTITVDGTSVLTPLEVVSDTELIVSTPYTENNIVKSFNNKPYSTTFSYLQNEEGLGTALSGSFGKFVITNLETFVGDVARVKIFRTSQADLTDFQFVQEIVLESTEILIDYESSQRNEENYGLFTPYVLSNYWLTSSNDITTEFNQSVLFNSVKLDSTGENTFHTANNISITSGVEYTVSFNSKIQSVNSDNFIQVYLQGTKNSVSKTQLIGTIESSNTLLQKTAQSFNFIGDDFDDSKLYFKVKGNGWYISTVSLRAAQETAFSPDEITFIQSVPRTLEQETFDFRFEFYDINNNYIPVTVTATKTFSAGNLNEIQKDIEIVATSLFFPFDSGSQQGNALPPKAIFFDINKQFLTGSTNFTSGAYDNSNNLLSASEYSSTFYPGLLEEISTDRYRLTVENFTGSVYENIVQYITYTAECEGVIDNITISRLADGKGGVNYDIRPFRGTLIRNSNPSSSVEIQTVRIDGINETNLRAGLPLDYSVPLLYVTSASLEGDISYITLEQASSSGYIIGLNAGTTGSQEINYNAEFNRDAINGQQTIYLIPSTATIPSSSILTSITLTDLQDGLNTGEITFDIDSFTIDPYPSFQNSSLARVFIPNFSGVTGSFFRRGETDGPISGTLDIYPSMSINTDYNPEYWLYYETGAFNEDIGVVVKDENKNIIQPQNPATQFDGSTRNQHKQLSVTFTYYEPFTTASVSVEKTFNIVPEGKGGDDAIIVEFNPKNIVLQANESRVVSDYSSTVSEIRVKQGNSDPSGYLTYQQQREPGTFYLDVTGIRSSSIDYVGLESANEGDTFITIKEVENMTDSPDNRNAQIIYPIEIRPYFTSSYFTTFVSQSFTRVDDGAGGRSVILRSDTSTVTYNGDGNIVSPAGSITLTAQSFNTTGSNYFYLFKDDNFVEEIFQNSTSITKEVPSSEFPAGGESQTYRIELHDGNNDQLVSPNAIASVTINGVQDGAPNYQAIVTNQNGFVLYKVGGELVFDNTSTTIEAYKGTEKLTHVSSFSFPTFDDLGNVVPNGEYQVRVHSFSSHLDLAGALVSQSLLTTNGNSEAFIDVLDDWTDPIDTETLEPLNGTGTVVFRVDFEDGRESALVQQNLSVQYEGNVGPGIIMRGIYDPSLDYQFNVPLKRRDAVIFPDPTGPSGDGNTYYWATLQPSGPGFPAGAQAPPTIVGTPSEDPRASNAYWEYLGEQEFFVAAKIAIFDESFVKNTINVGNNPGSEFANIVLAGGRVDPYIAVGQNGTVGDDGDQITVGVIGYDRPGVFMGIVSSSLSSKTPKFSLRNNQSGDSLRYIRWDGENIEILGSNFSVDAAGDVVVKGSITVTGGNATTTASLNASSSALIEYIQDVSASSANYVSASDSFLFGFVKEGGTLEQFANAVAFAASESAVGIATALTYALANGTLTGTANTFISEKFIYSPVIAGEEGVFNGKVAVAGGTMFLGNNVEGTNDGLYVGTNDYWYSDGTFSFGNGTLSYPGSGNVTINGAGLSFSNKDSIGLAGFGGYNTLTGSIDTAQTTANNASSSAGSAISTAVATLGHLQDVINGSTSLTGTFINDKIVYSPIIAGSIGYFSQSFGVGDISGGGGIVLDGAGPAIYIGNGNYANADTPFYVDGDGDFSLKDKLTFDSTTSTLTISGSVVGSTINGGTVTGTTFFGATGNFSGSLTAGDGIIGGWTIADSEIYTSIMSLNSNRPALEIYSGSELLVDINSNTTLTSLGAGTAVPGTATDAQDDSDSVSGTITTYATVPITVEALSVNSAGTLPNVNSQFTAGDVLTFSHTGQKLAAANIASLAMTLNHGGLAGTSFMSTGNFTVITQAILKDGIGGSTIATLQDVNTMSGVLTTAGGTSGTFYPTLDTTPKSTTFVYGGETNLYVYLRTYINASITIYQTAGNSTYSATLTAYTAEYDCSITKQISKTEIAAGGLQVVRDQNNYVIMDRVNVGDAMVQVGGDITATGNITAYFSDDRLKTRLNNIPDALLKINSLNGFTFKINNISKELGIKDDGIQIGVSAQEVQKVLPEIVKPAPINNTYLTVQYERLVPLLIEGIKELSSKVKTLENEIKKLKE